GDGIGELCARIKAAEIRLYIEPEGAAAALAALIDEALPEFEAAGDELALYVAYRARAQVAHMRALMDTALEALETAVVHAGLPHRVIWAQAPLAAARYFGSTPVPKLIEWLDDQERQGIRHSALPSHRATGLAMLGRFDEARAIAAGLRAEQADRGAVIGLALATGHVSSEVERSARAGVAIDEQTERSDAQGDSYGDVVEVLALGGKTDDAVHALGTAVAKYRRKGNLAGTRRGESRLAELTTASLH